jgi:hypothetical protein
VPAPHRAVRGGRVASARPWWPALPSLPACRSRLLARRREERKSPSKKRATISTITRMTPGIMSSSKTPHTSFWTSSFRRAFLDNFRLANNPRSDLIQHCECMATIRPGISTLCTHDRSSEMKALDSMDSSNAYADKVLLCGGRSVRLIRASKPAVQDVAESISTTVASSARGTPAAN